MGVGGVALLYATISSFKLIGLIFKAISWKCSGKKCTATVNSIEEHTEAHKKDKNLERYVFKMLVNCNDVYTMAAYEAIINVKTDDVPEVGDQLDLLFFEKDHTCRNFKQLMKRAGNELLIIIVSIAIFAGCVAIAEALG